MSNQNKKLFYISAGLLLILFYSRKKIMSSLESLIKKFEGLKLKAYQDQKGIFTIGFGSTYNIDENRPVIESDIITEKTALRWLRYEIANKQLEIKKLIKVSVNQNQLDSITSLAYNIGINALKKSTLLNLLNSGSDKNDVANQFLRWNKIKVNGKLIESKGLTNRRILEKNLFLS